MVKNPFPSAFLVWAGHRGNLRNLGLGTQLVGAEGITLLRTPGRPRLCPAGLRLSTQ